VQCGCHATLGVLETFCQINGLMVNVDNKNGNKSNSTKELSPFQYKGELIQMVQSFKYLGINVPLTNKWYVCML
jgi:predicted amidophosphoribosyltransferase